MLKAVSPKSFIDLIKERLNNQRKQKGSTK